MPPPEVSLPESILGRVGPIPPLPPANLWEVPGHQRDNLRICRSITATHARTFFFASHFLPAKTRDACYVFYAFCRTVDDTYDHPGSHPPLPDDPAEALTYILNRPDQYPFASLLELLMETYQVPRTWLVDLIHGCQWDQKPVQLETGEQLLLYCYLVASVVGLVQARIFGLQKQEAYHQALHMGIGMQLTNILRDVGEDFHRGRIYLPRESFSQFQLPFHPLKAEQSNPTAWKQLLESFASLARAHYREAQKGIPCLQPGSARRATRIMSTLYEDILTQIQRQNFPVNHQRCYVPLTRKLILALKAF